MEKFKFLPKDKISQLPKVPGVYAFKKGAKLLYIGKAANLKERIKQHEDLLSLTKQIGYIKTSSEIEALILEANLIKKYKPKYNVMWRNDKNYFFVGITKEDFPQVFITHQPTKIFASQKLRRASQKLKSNYIGPFVDGTALKATLKILRKIFPYRTCKNLLKKPCPPKFLDQSVKPTKLTEPQKLGRACLWYQLGRCPAPCLLKSKLGEQIPGLETKIKKECQKNIKNIMKILQGKKIRVLIDLKREMKKASLIQDFEKAAKIRDKIRALEKVLAHAKIFELQLSQAVNWNQIQKTLQKILKTEDRISRIEAYDISNIQGQEATGSMITFIKGLPDKKFYRKFKIKTVGKPNDVAMLKEILHRRINHPEWGWPDLILIDGGKAQLNAALQCLKYKFKEMRVMALAKKKNELFIKGRKEPILLKKLPRAKKIDFLLDPSLTLGREIFNLILQLRDEAHRFAISYHKKLRKKKLIEG